MESDANNTDVVDADVELDDQQQYTESELSTRLLREGLVSADGMFDVVLAAEEIDADEGAITIETIDAAVYSVAETDPEELRGELEVAGDADFVDASLSGDDDIEGSGDDALLMEDVSGDASLHASSRHGALNSRTIEVPSGAKFSRKFALGDVHPSQLKKLLHQQDADRDAGEQAPRSPKFTATSGSHGDRSETQAPSADFEDDLTVVDERDFALDADVDDEEYQRDEAAVAASGDAAAVEDATVVLNVLRHGSLGVTPSPPQSSTAASPGDMPTELAAAAAAATSSPLSPFATAPPATAGSAPPGMSEAVASDGASTSFPSPPRWTRDVVIANKPKRRLVWVDAGNTQGSSNQLTTLPPHLREQLSCLVDHRFVGPNAGALRAQREATLRALAERAAKEQALLQSARERQNQVFDKSTNTAYRVLECSEFDPNVLIMTLGTGEGDAPTQPLDDVRTPFPRWRGVTATAQERREPSFYDIIVQRLRASTASTEPSAAEPSERTAVVEATCPAPVGGMVRLDSAWMVGPPQPPAFAVVGEAALTPIRPLLIP